MKRHGNILEHAISLENLHKAYLDARRGKMGRPACFQFSINLGANLAALERELMTGTYQPRPYCTFRVYEPKERIILAPAFRDVVVQHALYRLVLPVFNPTFIDTSFACRPGKGTHAASDYVLDQIRRTGPDAHYLQLDVTKYFHSVRRNKLRRLLERRLKETALVDLLMAFADNGKEVGIPIGNLLSQLYANIYLSPIDHWIKRELKVRRYARYVDDLVFPGLARTECLRIRDAVSERLAAEYGMTLSRCVIGKQSRGVNFCGYRMWPHKRLIRKHSLHRFRRRVRASDRPGVVSLLGHAKRTSSLQHMLTFIQEANYELYCSLPESHHALHHVPARAA